MKTILAGYWLMANRARLRREQARAPAAPSVFSSS